MNELIELLNNCVTILRDQEHLLAASGEGYNLFSILMKGNEELMHSKIIASLLDPRGSHHQGSAFLERFLSVAGIDCFDSHTASVICEKNIGFNDGENPYGRIDIFIRDRYGRKIIIENKWDAGDQPMQLARYHEYAPDAVLLYLSRFGKGPSEASRCGLKDSEFRCISYSQGIIEWLTLCLACCETKPSLTVAIESYIRLIKKLNMPDNNNSILNEITKSAETLDAAFKISDELRKVKIKAQQFLWKELFSRLDNAGLDPEYCSRTKGKEIGKDYSLDSNITVYVDSKIMKEDHYRYGIRVKLGAVDGHPVYGAVLLNWNLYYAFYTDSKEINVKLASHFPVSEDWGDIKNNFLNFAWKYPYSTQYDFTEFKHKDIRALAVNDPTLVDLVFEGFMATYEEVRTKLNI